MIATAHLPENQHKTKHIEYQAIWDTGATGTAISQRVVDQLGLAPIAKTLVRGVHGEKLGDVYLINIGLKNKVGFHHVRVTKADLGDKYDVLIGMDIMNQGDFALSNYGGKTSFTFRVPSTRKIDFVAEDKAAEEEQKKKIKVIPVMEAGRNDPCPCGSGKKFKHCHWKE